MKKEILELLFNKIISDWWIRKITSCFKGELQYEYLLMVELSDDSGLKVELTVEEYETLLKGIENEII